MKLKISMRKFFWIQFALIFLIPGLTFGQSDFYQGKTIRIIHGRNAGGSGDLRVRAMVPFLQKYIPGNPTIIHEFMPGGGGRKDGQLYFRISGAGWIDHRQHRWRHGGKRGAR